MIIGYCLEMERQKFTKLFDKIARGLNGKGALNYSVSFGLFHANGMAHEDFKKIVSTALRVESSIKSTVSVTAEDAFNHVHDCLNYRGEEGSHHPSLLYLDSLGAAEQINLAINAFSTFVKDADILSDVHIDEGHPFYPIFWDFSILIIKEQDAALFIGSVSD